MTREEAEKVLGRLLLYCECPHHDCDKCVEAINMAIEALEQQTCDNCKYSEETDGMNCYECLKGISDNFEALQQEPCDDCIWFRQGVQRTRRGYAYERKTEE